MISRVRVRVATCGLVLALAVSFGALTAALAQTPEAPQAEASHGKRQRALELARSGTGLYRLGRWVEAYERFSRAEQLVHSPVFLLRMAQARRHQGKLLAARTLCISIIDEEMARDAPPSWQRAKQDARDELEQLIALIPTILIVVPNGKGGSLRVWIDGVGQPSSSAFVPMALDPGDHEVVVQRDDEPAIRRRFRLKERQHRLRLVFDRPHWAAPAPPASAAVSRQPKSSRPPPAATVPADVPASGWRKAGTVVMLVGGASLLVGIGTGIAAAVEEAELDEACSPAGVCDASLRDDVARYNGLATTSTVTSIAGAVALAAGAVVFLVAPGSDKQKPSVGLSLDGRGLSLVGHF